VGYVVGYVVGYIVGYKVGLQSGYIVGLQSGYIVGYVGRYYKTIYVRSVSICDTIGYTITRRLAFSITNGIIG